MGLTALPCGLPFSFLLGPLVFGHNLVYLYLLRYLVVLVLLLYLSDYYTYVYY